MPTFTMTQRKGGYEPAEVDAYISSLEKQLKEYEGKADAIHNAFISAQMASDKMIKQANEETAELIKKAKDEAAELVKKARDEADAIIKEANGEKEKIMAEAQKYSAAISENASEEIKTIHSNIAQQKAVIDNFTREYSSLIDKYLKAFDTEAGAKLTADLDKIDAMVSEWEKNGLPKPAAQPAANKAPAFANRPAEPELHKSEAPKPAPSPYTANSANIETTEEQAKPAQTAQPAQPKPFIKTGLGGSGLGGIPTNPGYGLPRERTLKPGFNYNEPAKNPFSMPEKPSADTPVNNMPKPAEAAQTAAPKPGIYKVSADNHLYNEHNQPDMSKPGIYKVPSGDNSFNNNSDL